MKYVLAPFFLVFFLQSPLFAREVPKESIPEVARYEKVLKTDYSLFTHRRTFLMPVSYVFNPDTKIYESVEKSIDPDNDTDYYSNTESEIQVSFFIPVYRKLFHSDWDLVFAYTHHAWWQLYNPDWSRPFRETDYVPELFFRYIDDNPNEALGFKVLGYDVGYMHESNGQIQLLSRSWNRIFARMFLLRNTLTIILSGWVRLPERGGDDNPSIERYKGVGQFTIQKAFGEHTLEFEIPVAENSGVDFRYSYPWRDNFRWFLSLRYGYAQSLIEYDRSTERAGVGIMLNNFFDRTPTIKE